MNTKLNLSSESVEIFVEGRKKKIWDFPNRQFLVISFYSILVLLDISFVCVQCTEVYSSLIICICTVLDVLVYSVQCTYVCLPLSIWICTILDILVYSLQCTYVCLPLSICICTVLDILVYSVQCVHMFVYL